jgi:hypothetical protein
MNPLKETYLKRIRNETAYPVFRAVIAGIAGFLFAIGGLSLAGGALLCFFILGEAVTLPIEGSEPYVIGGIFVISALIGFVTIAIGRLIKETSSVLADMADSITDFHSKYEQPQ